LMSSCDASTFSRSRFISAIYWTIPSKDSIGRGRT
jgi:hypothetical protein